jgi:hypothetical protein
MSHTYTITSVETVYAQASNDYVIEVELDLFDDNVSVGVRRFAYPTDTTSEAIKEELNKLCATLDSDKIVGEQSAGLEAKLANAELIKESLMSQ